MKKVLLTLFIVIVTLIGALLYEQIFVEGSLGPAAMFAVGAGSIAALFVLVTLLVHGTRYGEVMARVWLGIASVGISFLVLDLIAGALLIEPLSPPLVPDEFRHHKLVPDSFSRLEQRDFTYIQRVNSLGLRGEEVELEAPPGTYRILMLGDSFTMGKGVEDDETFSVLVEQGLNRRAAACGNRTIEVLNAGVDGYAPLLSYIQLKRELGVLKPDLIVLNLDMNDLVGEAVYRQQAVRGDDGEIIGVIGPENPSPIERFRSWTERNLYFTRLILLYVNQLFDYRDVRTMVTQANFEVLAHTLADDDTPRDEQWADLFESVTKIKEFANANEAEFALSTYPHAHQVNETEGIPGRYSFVSEDAVVSDRSVERIRDFAAGNGIAFVSLFPAFRGYSGQAPLYFNYDTHWTAAGHRIMAGGLEEFLASRFMDAWCE